MTFDEALDALWKGQVVRRHGWKDPDRIAYLTQNPGTEDFHIFSANVLAEDALEDDWYVWGWMQ